MRDRSLAQTLAIVFGLAFLASGILGFIPGITTNFVPVNNADDWLHLVLAVGLLGSWWVAARERPTAMAAP
jgi:hypothetical protein